MKTNHWEGGAPKPVEVTPHGVFAPSPQQQAVLEFVETGEGNATLIAVAGAGKTTTLVEISKRINNGVFAAYNKKIADEIGQKLKAAGIDWKQVRSATFHSLGLSFLKKWSPGIRVEEKKVDKIMEEQDVPKHLRAFVAALVSLAKQSAVDWNLIGDPLYYQAIVDHYGTDEKLDGEGAVLERWTQEGIEHAISVIHHSIDLDDEVIDFDDMIFAPLIHDIRLTWRYDWVLVDEAQDTNRARRLLAAKMLKPGGRLIAVGDPAQAIYGFAGADNDAMDLIERDFQTTRLPLTVTYRCPKAVVRHAQQWVSHIEAHESAPEGVVREAAALDHATLEPGDAILCRNTRPLVELAFDLIRKRIACHVEGRDIGQGLLTLATKWKSVRTIAGLRTKLHEYEQREVKRLLEKDQENRVGALVDKVETLRVLMSGLKEDDRIEELERVIATMFKDSEGNDRRDITLSTIHKSKGREWDRVYLLGRNKYQPSPYATQAWAQQQERNLCYVAVTRAKRELVEVLV